MRRTFAFDTETYLITPGNLAPKLVSFAYRTADTTAALLHAKFNRVRIKQVITQALNGAVAGDTVIVAHNAAFDLSVIANAFPELLPLIFRAYDAEGIECTKINEMLIDLYYGELRGREDEETGEWQSLGYSLDDVSQRRLNRKLDKGPDGWRLRYGELYDVPPGQWPERAFAYARDDADVEFEIDRLQREQAADIEPEHGPVLNDAPAQAAADFALFLMCCRGMITRAEYVAQLEERLRGLQRKSRELLLGAGILRADVYKRTGKPKLRKDGREKFTLVKAHEAAYVETALTDAGLDVHLTDKGAVSTRAEFYRPLTTDAKAFDREPEPVLQALQDYKQSEKLLGTYVPTLWTGIRTPIQPRVNVLLDTGRTSMSKPNLQNPPREHGIRECFVPPPGYLLCSVDYAVAELRSLAQCCLWLLGYSRMAELFQSDRQADPHVFFASDMSRGELDLELFKLAVKDEGHALHKRAKKLRKDAKAANFGFPGGMGPRKFVETNARVGNYYTEDEASGLRDRYLETWYEMPDYFALHAQLIGLNNRIRVQQFRTGRYRGQCSYTEACNTRFQGLTADISKRAMFEIQWACYVAERNSPLLGSFLVNFLHDEALVAVREDRAHEAAFEIARIMVEVAERYCPDIPAFAEPALMTRWYKDAAPRFEGGLLVPWQPKAAKAEEKKAA